MAMVPDIVKNMESYLEEEGTSRKSKQYFRYSYRGFLKIKGLLYRVGNKFSDTLNVPFVSNWFMSVKIAVNSKF